MRQRGLARGRGNPMRMQPSLGPAVANRCGGFRGESRQILVSLNNCRGPALRVTKPLAQGVWRIPSATKRYRRERLFYYSNQRLPQL